jgi:hypothetical protein
MSVYITIYFNFAIQFKNWTFTMDGSVKWDSAGWMPLFLCPH